mmetsp:Transcript_12934/g.36660  ORF Transcript_12934/g.36660 Transcript_12934/m.36660 type:complete len:339 (-) Transcript_12934:1775-2791(-)
MVEVSADCDAELFTACFAKADGAHIAAVIGLVHLLELRPPAPRPDGVDPVALVGPVPVAGALQLVPPAVAEAAALVRLELLADGRAVVLPLVEGGDLDRDPAHVAHRAQAPRALHLDEGQLLHLALVVVVQVPTPGLAPQLGTRVRAAEAEGLDAVEIVPLPHVQGLAGHEQGEALDREVLVELLDVVVRGDAGVIQDQDRPEEADSARAELQVADLGLRGPDAQGCRPIVGIVDDARGADLDGVAQGGACAVALGKQGLVGREARLLQRTPDASRLGRTARGRDTCAPPVLVHHRGGEAPHLVGLLHLGLLAKLGAPAARLLQEPRGAALAPPVAVG